MQILFPNFYNLCQENKFISHVLHDCDTKNNGYMLWMEHENEALITLLNAMKCRSQYYFMNPSHVWLMKFWKLYQ